MTEEHAQEDPNFNRGLPTLTQTHKDFRKNCAKTGEIFKVDEKKVERLETTYKELGLSDTKDMPEHPTPELIEIPEGASIENLIKIYEDYLGDRKINDVNGIPVYLDKTKAKKFVLKDGKDIKGRLQYARCIDDTITNPDEMWLLKNNRIRYIKIYDKNIMLLLDFNHGEFEYFNIMFAEPDNYADKQRSGIFIPKVVFRM